MTAKKIKWETDMAFRDGRGWACVCPGISVTAVVAAFVVTGWATPAYAQTTTPGAWSVVTRAVLSGTNEGSEPDGYKVYSALAFETGVRRALGPSLAIEVNASLQSREVTFPDGTPAVENLGSIEVLPINVLLQWHPSRGGRWDPYLGAGANVSVFWEKSGKLDSSDLTPSVGVAVQAGIDIELSPHAVFNVDFKWNSSTTDLEYAGQRAAAISLHPASLGLGLGFRF